MSTDSSLEAVVRVEGLSKSYGKAHALDGVSFSILPGEILGLIGPNGSGKTTLFECLAAVQPADRGRVVRGARPLAGRARAATLFYVPDGICPWPEQTVAWVLRYFVGVFGGRSALSETIVAALDLDGVKDVTVGALSKGQRKRLLLALGLLAPQRVLLIDEPFDGLDLRQSRAVAAVLSQQLTAERTFFLSIHQIGDAAKICDRFVLLNGGRVAAEGDMDSLTVAAQMRAGQPVPSHLEDIFLALT